MLRQVMIMVVVVVLGLMTGDVSGFPDGADDCSNLIPCHHGQTLDNAQVQEYSIQVTERNPSTLELTLSGRAPFMGFLLRAATRVPNQGHFSFDGQSYKTLFCSDLHSAVTHSGRTKKQRVTVLWNIRIPGQEVVFEATVVKDYTISVTGIRTDYV